MGGWCDLILLGVTYAVDGYGKETYKDKYKKYTGNNVHVFYVFGRRKASAALFLLFPSLTH